MTNNGRQRTRKEKVKIENDDEIFEFNTEETSIFLDDGNILSGLKTTLNVTKGVIPHSPKDLKGQCLTCKNMLTGEQFTFCSNCHLVSCFTCLSLFKKQSVCPTCLIKLKNRRAILILRKLFLEPFYTYEK